MASEFAQDRHKDLLRDANKHMGTLVLTSMVLLYAVFLLVVTPYPERRAEQLAIEAEQRDAEQLLEASAKFSQAAQSFRDRLSQNESLTIEWDPWLVEKLSPLRDEILGISEAIKELPEPGADSAQESDLIPRANAVRSFADALPPSFRRRYLESRSRDFVLQDPEFAKHLAPEGDARVYVGLPKDFAALAVEQKLAAVSRVQPLVAQSYADDYARRIAEACKKKLEWLPVAFKEFEVASAPLMKDLQVAGGSKIFASGPAQLQRLEREISELIANWVNEREGDRDWWRTFDEKGEATLKLTEVANKVQREARGVVSALLQEASELQRKVGVATAELDSKLENATGQLEKLDEELKGLLPSWLQPFLGVHAAVQLFPYLALLVMCYLLLRLWLIRYHFCAIRPHIDPTDPLGTDPRMSSVWTVAYRRRGTLATILVVGTKIGLIWFLFAKGSALSAACEVPAEEVIVWASESLASARLSGHALFAGSLVAMVTFVLRDVRLAQATS